MLVLLSAMFHVIKLRFIRPQIVFDLKIWSRPLKLMHCHVSMIRLEARHRLCHYSKSAQNDASLILMKVYTRTCCVCQVHKTPKGCPPVTPVNNAMTFKSN